jgi:hypothetical protein
MRLLALTLLIATLGATTSDNAPADTYFGRLKYSALRVRFTTQQLKTALEQHKKLPGDILHMAAFTQEAYLDWAHRYPKDHWLASSGYGLAQLYEELPGADARSQAIRLLTFVQRTFPRTVQARASSRDLGRGLPVRPLPAWAVTPSPSPRPSASGSGSPGPSPSATPHK